MKYVQLFTLELLHDYYIDRRCGDFIIEPTLETQKLLGNCRCVLKPLPNGIRVLSMVTDQGGPFIPLPDDATFGFHLRLETSNFRLFTDFSEIALAAAPLYINNGSNAALKLTSRTAMQTEHFTVKKPVKTDDFTLSGSPLQAVPLSAFQVSGLGAVSPQPVAFNEMAKVLRVNSSKAKGGNPFAVSYPIQPQLPHGVFADVEIKLAGGVSQFQVVFRSKKARWKYYVVTSAASQPAIEDKDKQILFDAPVNLTQSPDAADRVANELIGRHPGMQVFRFASTGLIPCQQIHRKAIQLQLNGEKVMDALPNPAIQNFAVDAKKEDSLYQIVKYFTQ